MTVALPIRAKPPSRPKPGLEALRRKIAAQERFAPKSHPHATFGVCAVDEALPDHGLRTGALHECLPAEYRDFSAAIGFSLALLIRILSARAGDVLWVAPAHLTPRAGMLYPVGLTAMGLDPDRVVLVQTPKVKDVLWALEEALENSSLAAAIGVAPENDRAYDFTASRRLSMRANETGATAILVRHHNTQALASAAETRWSISAEPSAGQLRTGRAAPGLGRPRWRAQLTKSKRGTLGSWRLEWDHETLSFCVASPLADRTPAPVERIAAAGWAAA